MQPFPGFPGLAAMGTRPFRGEAGVASWGSPCRVLIPFPEVPEGGFLVDEGKKWHLFDPLKKKIHPADPLEGYVQVEPGKVPRKPEPESDP